MALQDRYPDRFVNVIQSDIRHDPLGVVRAIYGKFGLTLSTDAEAAMVKWATRNQEHAAQGHGYGKILNDGPIVEAFAPYIERYGL